MQRPTIALFGTQLADLLKFAIIMVHERQFPFNAWNSWILSSFGSLDDMTGSNESELAAGDFLPLSHFYWLIFRDSKLTGWSFS